MTLTAFVVEKGDGYTTAGVALAAAQTIEQTTDVRVEWVTRVDFAEVGFDTHYAIVIDAPYEELRPWLRAALMFHDLKLVGGMPA
jgi:hypothetical protein